MTEYYSEKRERIERAFQEQFKPAEKKKSSDGKETVKPSSADYYMRDWSEDEVIVNDYKSNKLWKVKYSESDGKCTFDDKDKWLEVVEEKEYVAANGAKTEGEANTKEREETVKEMHDE